MNTPHTAWAARLLGLALVVSAAGAGAVPRSPAEARRFEGHTNGVWCLALSADGRRLLSGGGGTDQNGNTYDCTARVWEVEMGRQAAQFGSHRHGVMSVAFAPGGRLIACADRRETVLRDQATGRERRLPAGGSAVAFLPDGRRLVAGRSLWDAQTGERLCAYGEPGPGPVALSAGGREVLLGRTAFYTRGVMTPDDRRHYRRLLAVEQRDTRTGALLRRFEGQESPVMQVAFGGGGSRVLSASLDGTVLTWDAKTGKELRRLSVARPGAVLETITAFAPDGRRLLAGDEKGVVSLWDVESDTVLRQFQAGDRPISCLAFSPDGRLAASADGHEGIIRLWRLPR
jgi:WD40 repeat protein